MVKVVYRGSSVALGSWGYLAVNHKLPYLPYLPYNIHYITAADWRLGLLGAYVKTESKPCLRPDQGIIQA